ncbi:hypothetical protein COO60DRAFT_241472 [Scenedesmus sp. NREL 46B-D3]|nr:hypothetical protein COO60DRAFT_241472 [Scenedesmus sp. NREL 46B-D3]
MFPINGMLGSAWLTLTTAVAANTLQTQEPNPTWQHAWSICMRLTGVLDPAFLTRVTSYDTLVLGQFTRRAEATQHKRLR